MSTNRRNVNGGGVEGVGNEPRDLGVVMEKRVTRKGGVHNGNAPSIAVPRRRRGSAADALVNAAGADGLLPPNPEVFLPLSPDLPLLPMLGIVNTSGGNASVNGTGAVVLVTPNLGLDQTSDSDPPSFQVLGVDNTAAANTLANTASVGEFLSSNLGIERTSGSSQEGDVVVRREARKRKEREELELELVGAETALTGVEEHIRTLRAKRFLLSNEARGGGDALLDGNSLIGSSVVGNAAGTLRVDDFDVNAKYQWVLSADGIQGRWQIVPDAVSPPVLGRTSSTVPVNGLSEEELEELRMMARNNKKVGEKGRYSEEFLKSITVHPLEPRVIAAINGSVGFDVVDTDGRVFPNAILKVENGIMVHLAKCLFISRLMVKERTEKFMSVGGISLDSTCITAFVTSALHQFSSNIPIKNSFVSLSNLVAFGTAHLLTKDKNTCYVVLEQFIRGEFSATSFFRASGGIDLSMPLNVFSVSEPPYPSCAAQVTMVKCIELVRAWCKFLEIFCWVPLTCSCQWLEVFDGLIKRLEWGEGKHMDPFFFLDSFNNVLCDWFVQVKAPFFIEGVKYAFGAHVSAMLLLKGLLNTIVMDNQTSAIYEARKRTGSTLVCFDCSSGNLNARIAAPLNKSQNVCFHYLCTKLLSMDAPANIFCKNTECNYLHPTLAEVPALKNAVITFMTLKNIDPAIRTLVLEKMGKMPGWVP
jgi:hypothetical protein